MQTMMENRPCPSCGSADTAFLGEVQKTMHQQFSFERFSMQRCPSCEMIFLGQELARDDFAAMYEQSLQFDGSVYRDQETIRIAKEYYGSCYRKLISEIGTVPTDARVLEVGAGRAWMCMVADEIGKAIAVAQDVTAECATECPWVDIYVVGEITDPRIREFGPYDVISITHVIEHVPQPVKFLAALRSLLHERGRMFVTAPHRPRGWSHGSPMSEWETWSLNHVPGHLQYFSERAMQVAANDSGMQLVGWSLHEEGEAFEAILSRT